MAIVEYDTGSKGFDGLLTFVSILILVLLSGLFSGLTLGLLGLDLSELEIVKGGGSGLTKRKPVRMQERKELKNCRRGVAGALFAG